MSSIEWRPGRSITLPRDEDPEIEQGWLYDDGKLYATARLEKSGDYYAYVSLDFPEELGLMQRHALYEQEGQGRGATPEDALDAAYEQCMTTVEINLERVRKRLGEFPETIRRGIEMIEAAMYGRRDAEELIQNLIGWMPFPAKPSMPAGDSQRDAE